MPPARLTLDGPRIDHGVDGDPVNLTDPDGHRQVEGDSGGCLPGDLSCEIDQTIAMEEIARQAPHHKHCGVRCWVKKGIDVVAQPLETQLNFVTGFAAGVVDETVNMATLGAYDPEFSSG